MKKSYFNESNEEFDVTKNINLANLLIKRGYRLRKNDNGEYYLGQDNPVLVTTQNAWYLESRKIGGNAIDFLTVFEGFSSAGAKEEIISSNYGGYAEIRPDTELYQKIPVIPVKNEKEKRVISYILAERNLNGKVAAVFADKEKLKHVLSSSVDFEIAGSERERKNPVIERADSGEKVPDNNRKPENFSSFRIQGEPEYVHVFGTVGEALLYIAFPDENNESFEDTAIVISDGSLKELDSYLDMFDENVYEIYVHMENGSIAQELSDKIADKVCPKGIDVFEFLTAEDCFEKDMFDDGISGFAEN